jgi:hypothetical protein
MALGCCQAMQTAEAMHCICGMFMNTLDQPAADVLHPSLFSHPSSNPLLLLLSNPVLVVGVPRLSRSDTITDSVLIVSEIVAC